MRKTLWSALALVMAAVGLLAAAFFLRRFRPGGQPSTAKPSAAFRRGVLRNRQAGSARRTALRPLDLKSHSND